MGGDHRCSVCQATFTRPQHVARHMRSHTGDRPYKCPHCGDQFARSDLLSRHVNKCHADEEPPPSADNPRRRGSMSATRATTSKQACDQCVQGSLPCDGSNPCSKCVQRKFRCTFVKFHRQTAPSGPGHNPRSSSSSARLQSYADDYALGPPPMAAPSQPPDTTYSPAFTFPDLYPSESGPSMALPQLHESMDTNFSGQYSSHADFLRRTGSLPGIGHNYADSHATPAWLSWQPDNSYASLSDQRHLPLGLPDRYHNQRSVLPDSDYQAVFSEHDQVARNVHCPPYPGYDPSLDVLQNQYPQGRPQSGSADFSSRDSNGSGSHSIPSSGPPSSAHLPLTELQQQMAYHNLKDAETRDQTRLRHPNRGESSSAFGVMSLSDANALGGLSADAAPPFFSHVAMSMQPGDPDSTPMAPKQPAHKVNGNIYGGVSSRESETRELKDFWRDYMRTPLSGPGSAIEVIQGGQRPGMPVSPSARRSRVSSLPTAKTPPGPPDGSHYPAANPTKGREANGTSSMRTTLPGNGEDLRSYEAAVRARKALTNLHLVPRKYRTRTGNGSASTSPTAPYSPPSSSMHIDRPSSSGSIDTAMTLVGTFGEFPSQASSSSRESSVSAGEGSSDGRPSFKRLPSQTLGPANAKRALFSHGTLNKSGSEEGRLDVRQGTSSSTDGVIEPGLPGNISKNLIGIDGGNIYSRRVIVNLTDRHRRMSAPHALNVPSAADVA